MAISLTERVRSAVRSFLGGGSVKETVVFVESDEEPRKRVYKDERITRDPRRDLTGISHDRHLLVCNHLNRENPIGKRGVQNTTSFVASEGFAIRATSENKDFNAAVQAELDTHWELCQWDKLINKRTATLCVEGEWIYWCPSRSNGHFQLHKILPENVDSVTRSELDAEKLDTIVLKKPLRFREADGSWKTQDMLPIVNQDLWTGEYHGEVLYLQINALSGQTRGWSDLLVVADWLDRVDRTFWVEAERVEYQRAFAWFVELKTAQGETKEAAEARLLAKKNELVAEGPPKTGSVNAHLDTERWYIASPDLNLEDSVKFLEAMMSLCFGGLNMPVHFFASGGDVNKACHSEDTETLTAGGWKRLDELDGNETIATFNPDTGGLEWHGANSFHVYDHDGEMVHFSNKLVDVLVTPEHRMYAKRPRNNPDNEAYEIVQAQEIVSHGWKIPVAGNWLGGTETDFELPAVATGCSRAIYPALTIPGDLWAEFLGYFLSEGHVHTKRDGCYLVQLSQKKPGGIEKIRTCLQAMDALGFSFRETARPDGAIIWQCSDKGLHTWLVGNCGRLAKDKRLPVEAFLWTARRMRILFDALMLGDGSVDSRENRNSGCYYTSSKELADQVQTLCFMLGKQARITPGTRCHRLTICDRTEAAMDKESLKRVDYTGKVYCFNVPNHLFITRRNGKVVVSHNTAGEMGHPIWAFIRARKGEVIEFMRTGAALCLQRVKASGGLQNVPKEHMTFEVTSRDPDRTAYDLIGQLLLTLGQALHEATMRGDITPEAAGMAWRKAAGDLGLSDFIQPEGRVVDGQVVKSEPGLAAAAQDISDSLEAARPKLELVKPLAINGGKP